MPITKSAHEVVAENAAKVAAANDEHGSKRAEQRGADAVADGVRECR
jgi:hypothetical protein